MSKSKEPQVIGKIIATRIREIDHSYVENVSRLRSELTKEQLELLNQNKNE